MPQTAQKKDEQSPSQQATPVVQLEALESVLCHAFEQRALLNKALTHSSLAFERAAAEHPDTEAEAKQAINEASNEQLEFLGDAVVGLLVAESLCKRRPDLQEGQLSRLRAALVSRRHLGAVAALLHLGNYMRLGRGEERSGGRTKNAILANCIEAVIAALYLDAGLDVTRGFVEQKIVEPYLEHLLEQMGRDSTIDDHKSALQELLQARALGTPLYTVKSESGPDHRKRFVVEVCIPDGEALDRIVLSGVGTTKKKAEQEAARQAFEKLRAPETGSSPGSAAPDPASKEQAPDSGNRE